EVFVTAARALRKLAVAETLPAVTEYSGAELARWLQNKALAGREGLPTGWVDNQMSQLNQLLGARKYAPADPVLRKFLPKPMGSPSEARAAALWAVGRIHEGSTVPDLAKAAEARLNDIASIPPEDGRVRRMAAVLLGRLNAREALPSLRAFNNRAGPSENP